TSEGSVCNAVAIQVRSASSKGEFADRVDSARTGRRFPANSLPNSEHRRRCIMEISGMKAASIATLCLVAAARCYGTGGDSYEYPATLSDTLDILPGKSLGEIFLETSTIKPPAESWDPAKLREFADRIGKEPVPKLLKTADDLIALARASYTPGSDSCNLAHDVRDRSEEHTSELQSRSDIV